MTNSTVFPRGFSFTVIDELLSRGVIAEVGGEGLGGGWTSPCLTVIPNSPSSFSCSSMNMALPLLRCSEQLGGRRLRGRCRKPWRMSALGVAVRLNLRPPRISVRGVLWAPSNRKVKAMETFSGEKVTFLLGFSEG